MTAADAAGDESSAPSPESLVSLPPAARTGAAGTVAESATGDGATTTAAPASICPCSHDMPSLDFLSAIEAAVDGLVVACDECQQRLGAPTSYPPPCPPVPQQPSITSAQPCAHQSLPVASTATASDVLSASDMARGLGTMTTVATVAVVPPQVPRVPQGGVGTSVCEAGTQTEEVPMVPMEPARAVSVAVVAPPNSPTPAPQADARGAVDAPAGGIDDADGLNVADISQQMVWSAVGSALGRPDAGAVGAAAPPAPGGPEDEEEDEHEYNRTGEDIIRITPASPTRDSAGSDVDADILPATESISLPSPDVPVTSPTTLATDASPLPVVSAVAQFDSVYVATPGTSMLDAGEPVAPHTPASRKGGAKPPLFPTTPVSVSRAGPLEDEDEQQQPHNEREREREPTAKVPRTDSTSSKTTTGGKAMQRAVSTKSTGALSSKSTGSAGRRQASPSPAAPSTLPVRARLLNPPAKPRHRSLIAEKEAEVAAVRAAAEVDMRALKRQHSAEVSALRSQVDNAAAIRKEREAELREKHLAQLKDMEKDLVDARAQRDRAVARASIAQLRNPLLAEAAAARRGRENIEVVAPRGESLSRSDYEALQAAMEGEKVEATMLYTRCEELEETNRNLRDRVARADQDVVGLRSENRQLSYKLRTAEQRLHDLQEDAEFSTKHIISRLERRIDELSRRNDDLERQARQGSVSEGRAPSTVVQNTSFSPDARSTTSVSIVSGGGGSQRRRASVTFSTPETDHAYTGLRAEHDQLRADYEERKHEVNVLRGEVHMLRAAAADAGDSLADTSPASPPPSRLPSFVPAEGVRRGSTASDNSASMSTAEDLRTLRRELQAKEAIIDVLEREREEWLSRRGELQATIDNLLSDAVRKTAPFIGAKSESPRAVEHGTPSTDGIFGDDARGGEGGVACDPPRDVRSAGSAVSAWSSVVGPGWSQARRAHTSPPRMPPVGTLPGSIKNSVIAEVSELGSFVESWLSQMRDFRGLVQGMITTDADVKGSLARANAAAAVTAPPLRAPPATLPPALKYPSPHVRRGRSTSQPPVTAGGEGRVSPETDTASLSQASSSQRWGPRKAPPSRQRSGSSLLISPDDASALSGMTPPPIEIDLAVDGGRGLVLMGPTAVRSPARGARRGSNGNGAGKRRSVSPPAHVAAVTSSLLLPPGHSVEASDDGGVSEMSISCKQSLLSMSLSESALPGAHGGGGREEVGQTDLNASLGVHAGLAAVDIPDAPQVNLESVTPSVQTASSSERFGAGAGGGPGALDRTADLLNVLPHFDASFARSDELEATIPAAHRGQAQQQMRAHTHARVEVTPTLLTAVTDEVEQRSTSASASADDSLAGWSSMQLLVNKQLQESLSNIPQLMSVMTPGPVSQTPPAAPQRSPGGDIDDSPVPAVRARSTELSATGSDSDRTHPAEGSVGGLQLPATPATAGQGSGRERDASNSSLGTEYSPAYSPGAVPVPLPATPTVAYPGLKTSMTPEGVEKTPPQVALSPMSLTTSAEIVVRKATDDELGAVFEDENSLVLTRVTPETPADAAGMLACCGRRLTHVHAVGRHPQPMPVRNCGDIRMLIGGATHLILRFDAIVPQGLPAPPSLTSTPNTDAAIDSMFVPRGRS